MENTKTIARTFAVMDKPFRYGPMDWQVCEAGERFRIRTTGGNYGYPLYQDGFYITMGHGMGAVVPTANFHLEVEEEVVTVTKKPARRA